MATFQYPVALEENRSNWIKGVLIIFVLFDHNNYLRELFPNFFRPLTFHVVGFFVLAFPGSFNSKKNFVVFFWERFFRYIIPFLVFYTFYAVVSFLASKSQIHLYDFVLGAVFGSFELVKRGCGGAFMWFLPTLFGFAIIAKLFQHTTKITLTTGVLLGAIFYLSTPMIEYKLKVFNFFGIGIVLYLLPIVFVFYALYRLESNVGVVYKILFGLSSAVVAILTYAYLVRAGINIEVGALAAPPLDRYDLTFLSFLSTVSILLAIWILSIFQFLRFNFIKIIGKASLAIYLMHHFFLAIYFQLDSVLGLHSRNGLFILVQGMLSTTFAVILSLIVASSIARSPKLQALIFPRDMPHFLSAFSPTFAR